MARTARFQRYTERVRNRAQHLGNRLARVGAMGIAWIQRQAVRVSQATWSRGQKARDQLRRHALLLVGIIVLILFIYSLCKIPAWQVAGAKLTDKERLELMDKNRATLAQIWAGAGIALGLYFTWRRVAAAERTVQVATEGQITERFTRAIDQLGATDEHGRKRLEIRLGGIYALERIARDSEKDHWPIMEVFTSYVREHAPWKEVSPPQQDQSPTKDLQAILTVLGRRMRRYGKGEDQRLDLRGTDLRGANLSTPES